VKNHWGRSYWGLPEKEVEGGGGVEEGGAWLEEFGGGGAWPKNWSMVTVEDATEEPPTRGHLFGEGGGVHSGKEMTTSSKFLVRIREVDEEERGLWRMAMEEGRGTSMERG